jgi:hypothetical protein
MKYSLSRNSIRKTGLYSLAAAAISFMPVLHAGASAQDCEGAPGQTVGLFCNNGAYEGYTLFKPLRGVGVYLIDNDGNSIREWVEPDRLRGVTMILTEQGTMIRNLCYSPEEEIAPCQGSGPLIREYDWDGNVIWQYYAPGAHHDMVRMPNGNLLITVEQDDGSESLLEVKPNYKNWNPDKETIAPGEGGKVVWQWYVRDHVGANDPALFSDPAYTALNALDYHPVRKEILMSFNRRNEMVVIKKKTGKIVYRWGNPINYGAPGPVQSGFQHSTKWVKSPEFGYKYKNNDITGLGNILWFNNNLLRVDEIEPPTKGKGKGKGGKYLLEAGEAFGPWSPTWSYRFLQSAGFQSSTQRLPNGNTLIAFSDQMTFAEVDRYGQLVWKFVSPFVTQNNGGIEQPADVQYKRAWNEGVPAGYGTALHYNVDRYSASFKGFKGKDLYGDGPLVQVP